MFSSLSFFLAVNLLLPVLKPSAIPRFCPAQLSTEPENERSAGGGKVPRREQGSEGAREGYREEAELRFERQPQRSLEFQTITDTHSKDGI